MPRLLRIAVFALLSAAFAALGVTGAMADRRVALVLGNSKYLDNSLALTNPESDAADIAASLKNLGFDVTVALNANTRDMDMALKRFGELAATADTALFFYAGHALQYQGNNFLMPIDARLEDEIDLRRNMVSDEQIRAALERSTGVRIMILDACRNNPLADRFRRTVLGMTRSTDLTRGLARIDKAQGMVIAYAAAPGDVALDGGTTGRNSPFTTALLKRMQEPALEISTMFRRVTNDVWDLTRGRQRPEISSSLRNDYYLDPLADKRIWDRIKSLGDDTALREFINQFPYSVHVLDAQRRLELLDRSRRERDEQTRLERDRADADRVRRDLCQRETDELTAIGNDFAKLQVFAQRALCDQARDAANERLKAIVAQREEQTRRQQALRREEDARQKAELCRNEQATAELLWNDTARLQEFTARATCDQVRTAAADRARKLAAQRALEERARQEAERICRTEQQALAGVWNDQQKLQQMAQQATCEPVRVTAAERSKSLLTQRDQQEATAKQEAARLCQTEQTAAAAAWSDAAKLRELADKSKCPELRPSLTARIGTLVSAQQLQQQEQLQRQQAAVKLAALEDERNRQRREEDQRLADQQKRQQIEAKCKQETTDLASIESDVAKLREFVKRSGCEDVRSLTKEKIAQFERAEQACRDEDSKRNALVNQVKRFADRGRLDGFKQEIGKLDLQVTCARLKPSIAEALVMTRVKIAQVELKRLGCFDAAVDGNLSEATRDGAKLFLAKLGRTDSDAEFNEELLSELKRQNGRVCKPAEPAVATTQPNKPAATPRRHVEPPARPARVQATAAAPAPKPSAPRHINVIGLGN